MILFFRTPSKSVIATEIDHKPSQDEINELCCQPGVEAYKKNMFALLNKPGYEAESKAIQERLANEK